MVSRAGTGIYGLLTSLDVNRGRHPDHCAVCAEARRLTERELRALQDGGTPEPLPVVPTVADVAVRTVALEVVDTFRGATAPGLRTVVRHLHLALHTRG